MAGFLGSGSVYIDRKVGGVFQGFRYMGNATKFEIKENSEKKERISKGRADYGSALNTVFVKKPADVNVTIDDLDKENLALTFLGTTAAVSTPGASVTDEAYVAYQGKLIATAFRNISAVTVTGAGGTPTYVLNTDYAIDDAVAGLIRIIPGGGIADGTDIEIDYTYAAFTSDKVDGGTDSNIIAKILFTGLNQADQTNAVVNVSEAVLSPTTGVDFLSDDFSSIELAGQANAPGTGGPAYTVELNAT